MARIFTSGFDSGHAQSEGLTLTGSVTIATDRVRTGTRAGKYTSGGAIGYFERLFTGVSGRNYYLRGYFNIGTLPAAGAANQITLPEFVASAAWAEVQVDSNGALHLNTSVGADLGVSANGVISINTWHRVELRCNVLTAGNDTFEVLVDGTVVIAAITQAWATTILTGARFLNDTGGAKGVTYWVDDIALNDDSDVFPIVGTLVANFQGADTNPLPSWTRMDFYSATETLQRIQNMVSATAAGTSGASPDGITTNADCEAWLKLNTEPTNNTERIDIHVRAIAVTTTIPTSYRLRWIKNGSGGTVDSFQIDKIIAGVVTNIGALTAKATANSDWIGIRCDGNVISVWHFSSTGVGAPVSVISVTDSSITGGGAVGLGMEGTTVRLDNFHAGNLPAERHRSWPGAGAVYYLFPASDPGTSSANWTKPGGATTLRHTSVGNVPPVFETYDSTSGSAEDYLRNAVNAANADLFIDMQTYTAAGVPSGDVISLISAVINTGADSVTDIAGEHQLESNPVTPRTTFVAYDNGIASATVTTWPNKRGAEGITLYNPDVARGTAPSYRVRRTTATSSRSLINSMFIIVETRPASGPNLTLISIPASVTLTGVFVPTAKRSRTVVAGVILTPTTSRRLNNILANTTIITPAISRRLNQILASTITLTPAIVFYAIRPRTLAASLTMSAAFVQMKSRTLASALIFTLSLARVAKYFQTLAAILTNTAVASWFAKRFQILTAGLAFNSVLNRRIGKPITVTLNTGQALSFVKSKFITMPVVVTNTISIVRQGKYYKTLATGLTLTPAITQRKMIYRTLAANATVSAQIQLIRIGRISLVGNLPFTNAVARKVNAPLNSVVTLVGNIQVQRISGSATQITLASTVAMSVAIAKVSVISKLLSVSLFLDRKLNYKRMITDPDKDWLLSAKGLEAPQLDGAKLDEAILERTML